MRENQKGIAEILPILVIVVLIGVVVYFAFKNKQVNNVVDQPLSTQTLEAEQSSGTDNSQLQESILFSKYSPVEEGQLTSIESGLYRYEFTNGQDRFGDWHNNYIVEFPNTWSLFIYTNQENRDDHGTNIVFNKGNDYIRIKQQLYESGTCVFDEEDVRELSYLCDFVGFVKSPHDDWKVFTISEVSALDKEKDPWTRYGVCDQDKYAQYVSSYKTPDDHDKKACTPWLQVGEIEYFSISNDQNNFKDFTNIVGSIQILD